MSLLKPVVLEPWETVLAGSWIDLGSRVVADEVTARIERLRSEVLELLGHTPDGWSTLYRDPTDGRLWELTYLQSELHGGGPPHLAALDREVAEARYPDLAG